MVGNKGGRQLVALVLSAVAAVGAGCGGGEVAPPAATVKVKVGVLPITDVAPLYLGRKKGFFADERLEVEPRLTPGGSLVPAVVSGELDIGWSNTTSLITARSKGLPLRLLARGVRGGSTPEQSSADILVRSDGPVRSPKDLEGRTVSVGLLQSVSTLTANAALEKQGVDISKVRYVEVPFPQAVAALESGRIDAAYVAEPFATLGLRAGHRSISRPILETAPDFVVATYFTTERFLAERREVVDRFARAVDRSFDYAATHPEEVREVLSTYTEIPPEVAATMRLPDFSRYTDTSTIALTVNLAKKYGYIDREPDITGLLYAP